MLALFTDDARVARRPDRRRQDHARAGLGPAGRAAARAPARVSRDLDDVGPQRRRSRPHPPRLRPRHARRLRLLAHRPRAAIARRAHGVAGRAPRRARPRHTSTSVACRTAAGCRHPSRRGIPSASADSCSWRRPPRSAPSRSRSRCAGCPCWSCDAAGFVADYLRWAAVPAPHDARYESWMNGLIDVMHAGICHFRGPTLPYPARLPAGGHARHRRADAARLRRTREDVPRRRRHRGRARQPARAGDAARPRRQPRFDAASAGARRRGGRALPRRARQCDRQLVAADAQCASTHILQANDPARGTAPRCRAAGARGHHARLAARRRPGAPPPSAGARRPRRSRASAHASVQPSSVRHVSGASLPRLARRGTLAIASAAPAPIPSPTRCARSPAPSPRRRARARARLVRARAGRAGEHDEGGGEPAPAAWT